MLSKHLILYICILFLFFGFKRQNVPQSFKAQVITRLPEEVRQWSFVPENHAELMPYISLTSKKLLINSSTGNKEIPLPSNFYQLKTSPKKQYFALTQLLPPDKEQKTTRLVVKVYSDSVKRLLEVKQPILNSESIPSLTLLDNGQLIMGEPAIGRLTFFSPDGQPIREIDLFKDTNYDLERVLRIAPADIETDKIAVLASKRGSAPLDSEAPSPSGEPHLFLFDTQGNEIWRLPLSEAAPSNLAFSPDGKNILVSVYSAYLFKEMVKKTLLFRSDGSLFKSFPFLMKQAHFARSQPNVLIADRFTVQQINLETGKILWQHHFLPERGIVTALQLDETGQTAVVLTALNRFANHRFEFQAPSLHVFNQQGTLIKQLSFDQEKFLTPALYMKKNEIYVGFIQNLYKIEVQ